MWFLTIMQRGGSCLLQHSSGILLQEECALLLAFKVWQRLMLSADVGLV
jgi:hypothetical protein